jgi:hypothetical protein
MPLQRAYTSSVSDCGSTACQLVMQQQRRLERGFQPPNRRPAQDCLQLQFCHDTAVNLNVTLYGFLLYLLCPAGHAHNPVVMRRRHLWAAVALLLHVVLLLAADVSAQDIADLAVSIAADPRSGLLGSAFVVTVVM